MAFIAGFTALGAGALSGGLGAAGSIMGANATKGAIRRAMEAQRGGAINSANAASLGAAQAQNTLQPYADQGQSAMSVLSSLLYGRPHSITPRPVQLPALPMRENYRSDAEFGAARAQFQQKWRIAQQQAARAGMQIPDPASFLRTQTSGTEKGGIEQGQAADRDALQNYISQFNQQSRTAWNGNKTLQEQGWSPGSLMERYDWDQYAQDAGLSPGTTQSQFLQNPTAEQFARENSLTDNPAGWLADQLAAPTGFQQSPGYQFQLDQGLKAATNAQAARGMGKSGAAMKELNNYAQGTANQDYANWWNRQMGLKGLNLGQYGQWAGQKTQNNALNLSNFYQGAGLDQLQKNALYGRLFGLTGMGQNAAGQQGAWQYGAGNTLANVFGQQGQNQANLLQQQGQAQANMLGGIFNSLSNGLMQGAGMYGMLGGGAGAGAGAGAGGGAGISQLTGSLGGQGAGAGFADLGLFGFQGLGGV